MKRIKKLLAKLPSPKTDPLPHGWLKRYLIDWLIPTFFACTSVYLITWRFVEPFAKARQENEEIIGSMLTSIVKSFSTANSLGYHIALWLVGGSAFLLSVSQYLKFSDHLPYLERRLVYVVRPTTYWIFFALVKMATIIATPLSLVLAVAVATYESSLTQLAIFYLTALALVIIPVYHLMYHGLYAPFLYTLKVAHCGNNKDFIPDPEQTSQWLADTYDEIVKIFGGVWTSSLIASQDGKSGVLYIALPQTLEEYGAETRDEFIKIRENQKKSWNDRKFSCEDFSESAKKRSKKALNKVG